MRTGHVFLHQSHVISLHIHCMTRLFLYLLPQLSKNESFRPNFQKRTFLCKVIFPAEEVVHCHAQGFLSARLSFLELIGFGLSLFAKSSNEARLNLLVKGLPGLIGMLAGLTRTIGYEDRLLGKREQVR